ncbi:late competence protein ComEA, DNA receptor [Agrilactobacillus composti DSM 18527 = JCM 14202]|nr:ComEA family DNA-binding protein [Agrilactobacillus composti]GAF39073.1 late competence protein ComEA, DNA receptor [Agrilactobacillus composti DSM 18527 = JCM 14202]
MAVIEMVKRYYWIGLVLVLLIGGFIWQRSRQTAVAVNNEPIPINHQSTSTDSVARSPTVQANSAPKTSAQTTAPAGQQQIMVDVKGAVKQPGVYTLKAEDRVLDVLKRAGGFTPEADQRQVNLAQKVQDQAMLYIPTKGEAQPTASMGLQASSGTSAVPGDPQEKINLNTATAEQLQEIDGVGEKKAQKIIDFRTNQGPFKAVADLGEIDGFGDKTVANLEDKVTI